MPLSENQQRALDEVLSRLKSTLGDQLESVVLYGSAARADSPREVSDLNLLIVVKDSRPQEHAEIARCISGVEPRIEPFVVGRRGFERSRIAFAVKFLSIRRNYRVLHGADPLADFEVDPALRRFLAEQALRNLRLRFAHAFIVADPEYVIYSRRLVESVATLFTNLSEPMRIEDAFVPTGYSERTQRIQNFYNFDASVLTELLSLQAKPRQLSPVEAFEFHSRIFGLLDRAVQWVEAAWPKTSLM